MDYVYVEKEYGNGTSVLYYKNISQHHSSIQQLTTEERESENKRLSITKSRSNFYERANSEHYDYFFTFTSLYLTDKPELFLTVLQKFLKELDLNYSLILEINPECKSLAYTDVPKYHVHGLCNRKITDSEFTKWSEIYNADTENLYCEAIYTDQITCTNYIVKDIAYTKKSLRKGFRLYRSNNKKVDSKTKISLGNEYGDIYSVLRNDFDNNNSDNNCVASTNNDASSIPSSNPCTLCVANAFYKYCVVSKVFRMSCFTGFLTESVLGSAGHTDTYINIAAKYKIYAMRVKNRLSCKRFKRKKRKLKVKKSTKYKLSKRGN